MGTEDGHRRGFAGNCDNGVKPPVIYRRVVGIGWPFPTINPNRKRVWLLAFVRHSTLESKHRERFREHARRVAMWTLGWIALGLAALLAGAAVAVYLFWRPYRHVRQEKLFARARREFHLKREQLEAKFLHLAGDSGKPRGLRWVDCDFENDVTYARDKRNGQLSAFVGVTISFEAVEGGGMEEVEAVGNLRAATAVFGFDERRQWYTDGRAIFNLNPSEAIQYYQANLELVAQEAAGGR
jgi:hypothetical protein